MPAKITPMNKSIKPTAETALAGFQHLFDQMKSQKASWTNFINIQGQTGSFDMIRMLRSAFFMQAMTNQQLFVDYSDCVKINVSSLCKSMDANSGVLIYNSQSNNSGVFDYNSQLNIDKPSVEYLYLMGADTAIFLKSKETTMDWSDIYVLTFNRSLLQGTIKQMLNT